MRKPYRNAYFSKREERYGVEEGAGEVCRWRRNKRERKIEIVSRSCFA
jgi:hypothetical protein